MSDKRERDVLAEIGSILPTSSENLTGEAGTVPSEIPVERKPLHTDEIFLMDEIDRRRFAGFVRKSQKLNTLLDTLEPNWAEAYPLLQDTFVWFNRGGAVVKNPDRTQDGNEPLVDGATATKEAQEAALETIEDDVSSAMAVLEMGPVYEEIILKLQKEKKEQEKAEEEAQNAEARVEKQKGKPGEQKAQENAQKAREKAETARVSLQEAAGKAKKEVRTKMRAAARRAGKESKNAKDTLGGYGLESAGGSKRCSPEDLDKRIAVAQALAKDPAHRRLADLVGKLTRELFRRRASNATSPPQSINKVGRGNEWGRVLPHVLALLQHPQLKYKVLADAADRALPIYTTEEVPEEVKGAILCIRDKSGSMGAHMPSGYTRDEAATAYSLSLLAIAKSEGRPYFAIDFSSAQDIRIWTEADLSTPQGVMDFSIHGFGGGTAFGAALGTAISVMQQNPERLRNADVLFMTDVEANIEHPHSKWTQSQQLIALDARLWLYDVGAPGTRARYRDLPEVAAASGGACFNSEDLLSGNALEKLGSVTDTL